jgi:hypothetical protein
MRLVPVRTARGRLRATETAADRGTYETLTEPNHTMLVALDVHVGVGSQCKATVTSYRPACSGLNDNNTVAELVRTGGAWMRTPELSNHDAGGTPGPVTP